ncbi:MAG: TOBE domain-containing protein [Methylomonas sp.]|jgi:molybdate transport system regulatory protein
MHKMEKLSLCVQGEIRLADGLDNGMFDLLRAIDDCGSINQAAKRLGLSYKTAWTIIERANNQSPKTLIASETGGAKGGGTCLTQSGRILLDMFAKLEAQHKQFLLQLNQIVEADADVMLLLKPLTIKTSAANQLFGVVTELITGAVNTEVHVKLKGGEKICSTLSHIEAEALRLAVGREVLALINNNEISLFTGPDTFRISARNQLLGIVSRVQLADVDAEIVIYLPGGDSLTVLITRQSAENMGLKPGMQCRAVFKSNAILLATLPAN